MTLVVIFFVGDISGYIFVGDIIGYFLSVTLLVMFLSVTLLVILFVGTISSYFVVLKQFIFVNSNEITSNKIGI